VTQPRFVRLRFALAQASGNFVGGLSLPYFPLWLAATGLDASATAVVLSSAMFARIIVTPMAGIAADALGDRRLVAAILSFIAGAAYAALSGADGYLVIAVIYLIGMSAGSATGPIVEGVTARGGVDYGFPYAHVRAWGSLAFVAANVAGGFAVAAFGPEMVVPVMAALSLAGAAVLLATPAIHADRGRGHHRFAAAMRATAHNARHLLRSKAFLLLLAACMCAQSAHAVYYAYGTLHFTALGIEKDIIGLLWGLGVLAEVILFALSQPLVRRVHPLSLMAAGIALGALRWTGMAFADTLLISVLLQILHAGSFGLLHLGTMQFLVRAVPPQLSATGQALFSVACYGIGMGLVTLGAGALYDAIGGHAYLAMTLLSLAGLIFVSMLARRWDGGPVASLAD